MKKKVIVLSAAVAAVILLVVSLSHKDKNFTSSLKDTISFNRTDTVEGGLIKIYQDIHHMSHHVIIAQDKWVFKELTLENIQNLIDEVNEISDTEDTTAVL